MFAEPGRTQFDLNFRLGNIPVRIHPWYWITTVILAWPWLQSGWQYFVLWIVCMFVSILVHELGHILMGRLFGSDGHIVLYGLGGLAVGSSALSRRWQRMAVSFAGPLAGFILFGLLVAGLAVFAPPRFAYAMDSLLDAIDLGQGVRNPDGRRTLIGMAIEFLFFINLLWGLVNLLPILPLDGGHISQEVWSAVSPSKGVRIALILSIVIAGLLAVNGLLEAASTYFILQGWRQTPLPYIAALTPGDPWFIAIFFGLLAVSNFLALQRLGYTREQWQRDEEDRMAWERDPDYWKKGRQDDDYWER